jgi:hypothetical protein
MAGEINCENNHLSPEEQLKGLFTLDADGNVAIRTIAVVGCEEGIDCNLAHLPLATLLAMAIGSSACGKPALRLAQP